MTEDRRRAGPEVAPAWWLGVALVVAGCEAAPRGEVEAVEAVGEDCLALIAAGARARACDPAIAALLEELGSEPEEPRCRAAARRLLAPPTPARGRVVSVYERGVEASAGPLDAGERAALSALPLPGLLVLAPDLTPKPGLPATTGSFAGAALEVGADGRLRGHAAPGSHTLEVLYANDRGVACVTLAACETLVLTAHGAALAPHPAVRVGPCELARP